MMNCDGADAADDIENWHTIKKSYSKLGEQFKLMSILYQEVNKKIENVYSKFKHMLLKRDDTSKNAMTAILTK